MTVRCGGDSWVMEQVGEKQDFEAELSRQGLRHEDFVLHVRRGGLGGIVKGLGSRYVVRVTDRVTGNHRTYWGGTSEDWVVQFAHDAATGAYRALAASSAAPVRSGGGLRHD